MSIRKINDMSPYDKLRNQIKEFEYHGVSTGTIINTIKVLDKLEYIDAPQPCLSIGIKNKWITLEWYVENNKFGNIPFYNIYLSLCINEGNDVIFNINNVNLTSNELTIDLLQKLLIKIFKG